MATTEFHQLLNQQKQLLNQLESAVERIDEPEKPTPSAPRQRLKHDLVYFLKKAIMNKYPKTWFTDKILANLGVYDEFGPQFSTEEVLNHKCPLISCLMT
jgi:hypothetical protein